MGKFLMGLLIALALSQSANAQRAKVLYLGDTRSLEGFGETVESNLRAHGADVFAVVDGGAGPYHWLKEYQQLQCEYGYWEKTSTTEKRVNSPRTVPKVETLIDSYQPNVVVVQTGSNLYASLRSSRRSKEDNIAEVRLLVTLMSRLIAKSGAKAYWILPPHTHEKRHPIELQSELSQIMKTVVEENGGKAFDSRLVTHYQWSYPETDGISYSRDKSVAWAQRVLPDLTNFIGKNRLQREVVPLPPVQMAEESLPTLDPFSALSND